MKQTKNNAQLVQRHFSVINETGIYLDPVVFSWEQRKLGDVLVTVPFKPYLKLPVPNGKYAIIQQGNEPVIGYADGHPCTDFQDSVIFGDHTLSLYKPKEPFFVATDGVRILKAQNITGHFLSALLEKAKPQNEGYKRYYSILTDVIAYLTNNNVEQTKIGQFFLCIDDLIALHQRKQLFCVKV